MSVDLVYMTTKQKISSQTRARNAGISSIEILRVALNFGCSNEEAAEMCLANRAAEANHSAGFLRSMEQD